jgi:hypothetical protein
MEDWILILSSVISYMGWKILGVGGVLAAICCHVADYRGVYHLGFFHPTMEKHNF